MKHRPLAARPTKRRISPLVLMALTALSALAACSQNKSAPPSSTAAPPTASGPIAEAARAPEPPPAPAPPAPSVPPVAPSPQQLPSDADRAAGAALASQGAPGIAACSGCHGPQGEGVAPSGFPRLAGLGYDYLQLQLAGYADGRRTHPVMTPIAKAMSPAQWQASAAHYAGLPPRTHQAAPATRQLAAARNAGPAARAAQLANVGDESRDLQACANCHGRDGGGMGSTIPALAGQHASYLIAALAAWRDGSRRNDPSGQMPRIARALGEADARALADWYAALPVPVHVLLPAQPSMRSVQSGPQAPVAAQRSQGVGSEQGAPVGGGSTGPGGGGTQGQGNDPAARPPARP